MNKHITPQLPDLLLDELKNGCPALLLTVGEDGFSAVAFTWVVALNETTIRFAADLGSTTLENLERDRQASLEVIAQGNIVFLIKGKTLQIKPQIEASSFKMTMMHMEVVEAKDQSISVANVRPLSYEWVPEQQEAMLAMENAIYVEMREWNN